MSIAEVVADPVRQGVSHPVVDLIWSRVEEGSKPGARTDGFKLALAIEGGSMRGVISAAMTAALEQLGTLDAFDAVYGSSAGAINGAYFIAGRAALCTSSYYEEMTTSGFLSWRRALLRRGPALSLDFVLDDVAEGDKPLDWDAVLESPIEFHPMATSIEQMRAVDLHGVRTKQQLKDALRASAQVWLAAGPPFSNDEGRWLDASIFVSNPFGLAIADGYTHVLALRTRPWKTMRSEPSFFERFVIARRLARIRPELGQAFLRRAECYREEVEKLDRGTHHPDEEPHLFAIAPPEPAVGSSERNPRRVKEAARRGIEAVFRELTGDDPQVIEVLRGYPRP